MYSEVTDPDTKEKFIVCMNGEEGSDFHPIYKNSTPLNALSNVQGKKLFEALKKVYFNNQELKYDPNQEYLMLRIYREDDFIDEIFMQTSKDFKQNIFANISSTEVPLSKNTNMGNPVYYRFDFSTNSYFRCDHLYDFEKYQYFILKCDDIGSLIPEDNFPEQIISILAYDKVDSGDKAKASKYGFLAKTNDLFIEESIKANICLSQPKRLNGRLERKVFPKFVNLISEYFEVKTKINFQIFGSNQSLELVKFNHKFDFDKFDYFYQTEDWAIKYVKGKVAFKDLAIWQQNILRLCMFVGENHDSD